MSYSFSLPLKPLFTPPQIAALAVFVATGLPSPAFGQDIVSPSKNLAANQLTRDAVDAGGIKDGGASVERFHDWQMRCVTNDKSHQFCEIAQVAQVMREQGGVTVLTLALAPDLTALQRRGEMASPSMILTMLVPLNVALPAGLSISADGKPITKLAYRNCNQSGCWVQTSLKPTMLSALKTGKTGGATLSLIDGQAIDIRFSLTGLTAALAALESQTRKWQETNP
ncbi:invasion associated locus B family protein [Rhizobium sp. G187]|uniref:invasion associated locus B family protein n=1 Tax=Rhizobium sp. G187 TaxID=3451352 RepID=UPI003EE722EA